MRIVVLRIDLPEQGLARPQRPHQGVLATHAVKVAAPEQAIEAVLLDEWHFVYMDGALLPAYQGRADAGWHKQDGRIGLLLQCPQQPLTRCVGVAEKTHLLGALPQRV